ncbi:predicted protein [Chaetoceros tenuissimus]|uniref:Uncharacterized protein n=1 Tax=Chaetoceros tenuissimus TaxID=426638 RepID=A0AAD3D672_9STRA|nr:predicted protein [Chaetoceros tenuissimus]
MAHEDYNSDDSYDPLLDGPPVFENVLLRTPERERRQRIQDREKTVERMQKFIRENDLNGRLFHADFEQMRDSMRPHVRDNALAQNVFYDFLLDKLSEFLHEKGCGMDGNRSMYFAYKTSDLFDMDDWNETQEPKVTLYLERWMISKWDSEHRFHYHGNSYSFVDIFEDVTQVPKHILDFMRWIAEWAEGNLRFAPTPAL